MTRIMILSILSLSTLQFAGNTQSKERRDMIATEQSQTKPHTRARTKSKITVQSSEAQPYDQMAGPVSTEIRLSETFTGVSMASQRFGLYKSYAVWHRQQIHYSHDRAREGLCWNH
jgi:hypothetical protein